MRRLLLLFVVSLFCVGVVSAQTKHGGPILFEVMWGEISKELSVDQDKLSTFKPIYEQYWEQMGSIGMSDRRKRRHSPESLTDAQANELIVKDFARTEDMLKIRKIYYEKFKTVLTPKEIYQLYGIERCIKGRVMREMQKRESGALAPNNK